MINGTFLILSEWTFFRDENIYTKFFPFTIKKTLSGAVDVVLFIIIFFMFDCECDFHKTTTSFTAKKSRKAPFFEKKFDLSHLLVVKIARIKCAENLKLKENYRKCETRYKILVLKDS